MTAYVPFSSLLSAFLLLTTVAAGQPARFRNPLFDSQDPSVAYSEGVYYYCDSDGDHIRIRSSRALSALGQQRPRIVWTATKRGWDGHANVWAPELHHIGGIWYLYFAADYRTDGRHKLYVLVGGQDPFGPYTEGHTGGADGQLIESTNRWAIDPHVFTGIDGRLYLAWSCTDDDIGKLPQSLCLARMADPLHVDGPTVRIATPTEDWETRTGAIEEGPFAFIRDGITYLLYSSSASWTPNDYAVGVLINRSGDLLNPEAWTKHGPIFDHHGTAYGPGAVVFVDSPDGSELWAVYHAYDQENCAQWACRSIRMQKIGWSAEGPVLGYPVNPDVPLLVPSGDAGSPTGWGDASMGTAAAGSWRYYSSSMLESSMAEDAGGLHQAFRGDVNRFAYAISADVAQSPESAGRSGAQYGLYALFYDSNNYVQAFIDVDARAFASRAMVAGVDQGQRSSPLPERFDFERLHRIVVEKSAAGQFTFYLDETKIDQRSIRLQRGQIGVFTYNTAARFERIAIEDRSFGWGDAFGDAAEGLDAVPPGRSSDGYVRGAWEIADESTVTSHGGDPGWTTLYRGNPNRRSYTVQVDARLARDGAVPDRSRYGLIVCHDDRNNQVTLWVDPAAQVLAVNSVINGDSTWRTAGLPPDFDPTAFHTLGATKSGNQFTFLLDGLEILREEIAVSTGMAGVITEDARVEFRKLAIRDASPLNGAAVRRPGRSHPAVL